MKTRIFSKVFGVVMTLSVLFSVIPGVAFAATLSAPSSLSLSSGYSSNDTTPTFRWSQPFGATWYSYHVDLQDWKNLGNVSSVTVSALADGWHTFYVRAHDNSGNVSAATAYTFEIDTQGPTVPAVSPSSADEDEEVTFFVTPYGESVVTFCDLYVGGDNVGTMTKSGGTFSKTYTFAWEGNYTVYARCADGDGNYTTGTSRTVSVDNDDYNDAPTVPAVTPSTAVEDEEVTIYVEPYSDEDVAWCDLYVNDRNVGDMERDSDGEFSLEYTFANDGFYTVYATCTDESYDTTRGTSRTIRVSDEDEDDDYGTLSVPRVSPSSTYEDSRTEFTVRPSGNYNVTDCWLYVDGRRVATMTEESTNVFTADYTFRERGSYSVYAMCEDSRDNQDIGEKRTVTVQGQDEDDDGVYRGSLLKIRCGTSPSVNDPCRAVYYYGEDGKRHAFPDESTFKTWYADFDDVIEISASSMASLPLGSNVTYRPGSVLIKFASSAKVYAIEGERTLRHYKTMELLRGDYGWDGEKYIVALPDYLYSSYEIGSVIDSSNDFDRTEAYYSVDSIDDVL
ncbi:hypothetical protein EBT31_01415 [bacterium]|nr:hypothetical protein [bacterium]NBX49239.1 hypothetical protein [bacterium]